MKEEKMVNSFISWLHTVEKGSVAFELVLGLFCVRLGFLVWKMDAKTSLYWEVLSEIKPSSVWLVKSGLWACSITCELVRKANFWTQL